MALVDLQQEAGLGGVCRTAVYKVLKEEGIKAYVEEFKFILDGENMKVRKVNFNAILSYPFLSFTLYYLYQNLESN